MTIRVTSYAGYRAEERPKTFILQGKKIEVHKISAQWREEDRDCFRVVSPDGNRYLLCYARRDDTWDAEQLDRQESIMDRGQYERRDRLVKEKRHDTYRERGKGPEVRVCTKCNAVFSDGRWSWSEPREGAKEVVCPACQRIIDNYPAGYIEIKGPFFKGHREELLNLIHNEEKLEKGEHPMERIMAIVDEDDHTLITTTGVHIARRLGDALSRAYQGHLDFQYGDAEKSIRVSWNR